MKSSNECWFCNNRACDMHHVFNGPLRSKSEVYGAVIPLCRECHEIVHKRADVRLRIKAEFQRKIMQENGMSLDEFVQEFHKNYLSDGNPTLKLPKNGTT